MPGHPHPFQLLTDDGHEGVEVANVEALAGHVDEELDHLGPSFLFGWLGTGHLSLSNDRSSPYLDYTSCSPSPSFLAAEMCDLDNL